MDRSGDFYLGRIHDLKTKKTSKTPFLYDPDDLTTHGVVFGMTGSGKTGLCISLLEEAALLKIPAIMIDPKGDITNALLHFPELLPEDFLPWVNPDEARRDNVSIEQAAKDAAELWSRGLADWDIPRERISALSEAVKFTIYTPGSDSGQPVNIVASLKAPDLDWDANKEVIRERISSTVTAILGLVGFKEIDPVKQREHILLSNLFEAGWSQGLDLELSTLIQQVQNPPLEKLGVFEVDKFMPPKERGELAIRLNSILAAPSFQSWLEGTPLQMEHLLYTISGKPSHSVFLLSHLSDAERMFFVTLLYSAVESWMRAQPGSSSLRAIVYFDEIHGFLPPVAEPPSKEPMLRLLKQARAFGVGQLLCTQNPVDVDYKALSNAGTWFIGKLQTERDKDRLLDGLEGAAAGSFKRSDYTKMISSLEKRVFLAHNVHEKEPVVFYTRWAMNYLPGPLTRNQIPALNALAGHQKAAVPAMATERAQDMPVRGQSGRPVIPSDMQEMIWRASLTFTDALAAARKDNPPSANNKGLIYRPALFATAVIQYKQQKYSLNQDVKRSFLIEDHASSRKISWEENELPQDLKDEAIGQPDSGASFANVDAFIDIDRIKKLEKDFSEWIYRKSPVDIWMNAALKFYGSPGMDEDQFLELSTKEAEAKSQTEIAKAKQKFGNKLKTLQRKLAKEQRELAADQEKVSQRRIEEMGTHLENVLGLFGGSRRRLTTSLTKRRLTAEAKSEVDDSRHEITALEAEIQSLGEEVQIALEEIENRWDQVAGDITTTAISPARKDVYVDFFGIAWLPFYVAEIAGRKSEIPAFKLP